VPRASIKPPYHDRVTDYDAEDVQKIWEETIELDLDVADPYRAKSNAEYGYLMSAATKAIALARRNTKSTYSFKREPFRRAPYSEQKVVAELFRFESRMAQVHHGVCSVCHECSINISLRQRDSVCDRCTRKGTADSYNESNVMLPIWYDNEGTPQYHVPEELSCLTIAEVLLIQRVSPLVPIVHIRNGTMGIKGHVCSFRQDVSSVATSLPNLPERVKAVKMVRTYKDADGAMQLRTYMVNRKRVMRALLWLIKYHVEYKRAHEAGELAIDDANLSWMGNEEEAELPSVTDMTRTYDSSAEVDGEINLGVSKEQAFDPETADVNSEIETSGIACPDNTFLTNEAQDAALRSLKEAAKNNPDISVLDWPQQSNEALSEYSDERVFVNAFPHLFPGGIADVNELDRHTAINADHWTRHLLHYRDGRFARDPIWPFFAYNYCLRKRNTQMGSFFVKSHISNPPRSIDELKQKLQDGDSSFVNKIMFYSKRSRGTDAYWRHKRAELYNWIHYHIAAGNGAPTIFLTLSCAEYFWTDMIRLLEERVWIAEGRNVDDAGRRCYRDGKAIDFTINVSARNKAVNDYSIVVQEFFIKRLEDWLDTVGKRVLGIEHYWCRLEFAKGRGQIHAHLIAIIRKDLVDEVQSQIRQEHMNADDEARVVGEWAVRRFGLSAKISHQGAAGTEDTSENDENTTPSDETAVGVSSAAASAGCKYYEGGSAYYIKNGQAPVEVKIVKIHYDDDLEPFFTICLPNGNEKQTDDAHLKPFVSPVSEK
jgi:hypothetical protein